MAFERSMVMAVRNAVATTTLAFGSPQASDGPPPSANPSSAGPRGIMTVSAKNHSGGCVGSFTASGGGANFTVSYRHPLGVGATTLSATANAGYVWGTDAADYSGHDVTAQINLYRGVAANASGGYAVPLELLNPKTPFNNCQDFANSMYGPNMRSEAQVQSAYGNPIVDGYVAPADFTGGQIPGIVDVWASAWINGSDPRCPPQDAALLAFFSNYLKTACPAGPLSLWLPQIAYQAGTSPSVFLLSGYSHVALADNSGHWIARSVGILLTLLAAGAHFVVISATDDLPAGVTVQSFDSALTGSNLTLRHDPGNSHYTSITNITGSYYLSVTQNFAPPDCGLLLAFLAGRTVNDRKPEPGTYNTFIQLEGWQAGSSRHGADYDTYKATLWNISTYGACPYSEKRATSIFVAPPGWTPRVYQTTRMMPYVGAYAKNPNNPQPQGWLNTAMVQIPANAPALPPQYFT